MPRRDASPPHIPPRPGFVRSRANLPPVLKQALYYRDIQRLQPERREGSFIRKRREVCGSVRGSVGPGGAARVQPRQRAQSAPSAAAVASRSRVATDGSEGGVSAASSAEETAGHQPEGRRWVLLETLSFCRLHLVHVLVAGHLLAWAACLLILNADLVPATPSYALDFGSGGGCDLPQSMPFHSPSLPFHRLSTTLPCPSVPVRAFPCPSMPFRALPCPSVLDLGSGGSSLVGGGKGGGDAAMGDPIIYLDVEYIYGDQTEAAGVVWLLLALSILLLSLYNAQMLFTPFEKLKVCLLLSTITPPRRPAAERSRLVERMHAGLPPLDRAHAHARSRRLHGAVPRLPHSPISPSPSAATCPLSPVHGPSLLRTPS